MRFRLASLAAHFLRYLALLTVAIPRAGEALPGMRAGEAPPGPPVGIVPRRLRPSEGPRAEAWEAPRALLRPFEGEATIGARALEEPPALDHLAPFYAYFAGWSCPGVFLDDNLSGLSVYAGFSVPTMSFWTALVSLSGVSSFTT